MEVFININMIIELFLHFRFLLRIRVLPKTPQHLFSQDPVSFSYYYDQVVTCY